MLEVTHIYTKMMLKNILLFMRFLEAIIEDNVLIPFDPII